MVGLLAGSVFGLLFAPSRGKTTRKKLQDEIKKGGYGQKTGAELLKDIGKDLKVTGKEAYDESGLDDKVDEIKMEAAKMKKKAEKMAGEMADKVTKEVKKKLTPKAKPKKK